MGTPYTAVKDSGTRQSFDSGSVRDSAEGKGRFDLLSPIFLARLAQHTENGARKYSARNWEKGQPVSRYMDSALRHLFKYLEGHRDEDHLAAAAWNIQGMIHTQEMVDRGSLPAELAAMPDLVSSKEEIDMWELEDGTPVWHDPGPFNKPFAWLPDLPLGWVYTGEHRVPQTSDSFLSWSADKSKAEMIYTSKAARASDVWTDLSRSGPRAIVRRRQ